MSVYCLESVAVDMVPIHFELFGGFRKLAIYKIKTKTIICNNDRSSGLICILGDQNQTRRR